MPGHDPDGDSLPHLRRSRASRFLARTCTLLACCRARRHGTSPVSRRCRSMSRRSRARPSNSDSRRGRRHRKPSRHPRSLRRSRAGLAASASDGREAHGKALGLAKVGRHVQVVRGVRSRACPERCAAMVSQASLVWGDGEAIKWSFPLVTLELCGGRICGNQSVCRVVLC